jgi:hypothetical protein
MAAAGDFCFWLADFSRRILKISQSETRIACGVHVCQRIGTKWAIFTGGRFFHKPLKTWPPQVILVSDWLIFFNSSLLKPIVQMNGNLVGRIYVRFIWPIDFRREDLKKISQSETRIACGGHVC